MTRHLLTAAFILLGATGLSTLRAEDAGKELDPALKNAQGWENYAFTIDEKPGPGTQGVLEAKYAKGKPLSCKADRIECYRKGDAVVYQDLGKWERSRTGRLSDPLRVLGTVAKVKAARLPHEEIAGLAKLIKDVKKAARKDAGNTVYTADLDAKAARSLAREENRSVARSGTARFWVNGDGKLIKYAVTIKLKGVIGNAEVDGKVVKTVKLSGAGSTEVKVPAAALKALE
jgi:hypothetical protein